MSSSVLFTKLQCECLPTLANENLLISTPTIENLDSPVCTTATSTLVSDGGNPNPPETPMRLMNKLSGVFLYLYALLII